MEESEGTLEVPINSFSLVAYLPEPLAGFVDSLRREFQPGSEVRSHVTVLPPRPLSCSTEKAWEQLNQQLQEIIPFRIQLGGPEIFPVTEVVHLAIAAGATDLLLLHERLASGACEFRETYSYHPHVTLAQYLPPEEARRARDLAQLRWNAWHGERSFLMDRLTLVQNTQNNRWLNLREFTLRAPVTV